MHMWQFIFTLSKSIPIHQQLWNVDILLVSFPVNNCKQQTRDGDTLGGMVEGVWWNEIKCFALMK